MNYVYVLFSEKFVKTYVGLSTDVERRLKEHNAGKSTYTSKYRPWKIVHLEAFEVKTEARKREKYLKSAAGRCWMKANIKWPRSSTG